ncbi:uncharacterized protein METZ01_LOCUS311195 [marine metagenome]|uniref:Uncharacterized protein n=1 Tax=marine metagenome TaxID=408172 RepID=A0A382NFJ5_9ZZZZ
MKNTTIILVLSFTCITGFSHAQEGETWDTGEKVYEISTIDLEPNVDPIYLNNIKRTWVIQAEAQKSEGIIEDYFIYRSINQYDGDFDLILMQVYPNLAALDSNPKNRKKWDRAAEKARKTISEEAAQELTATYGKLRTIRDQKLMREIKFRK